MVVEPEVSLEAAAALMQRESELEIGALLTTDRNRTIDVSVIHDTKCPLPACRPSFRKRAREIAHAPALQSIKGRRIASLARLRETREHLKRSRDRESGD